MSRSLLVGHRTTISEVAHASGVSMATVSKVVNRRSGVSEATRERVADQIRQLGYVSIVERQTATVVSGGPSVECLMTLRGDGENPYFATLLAGIVAAAEQSGITLVLHSPDTVQDSLTAWAQQLARSGRAGVIEVTSARTLDRQRALTRVGLPMIVIDPLDNLPATIASVGAANWSGALLATRHLLNLGHRRIAYIGGPPSAGCDHARLHGWAAAMQEAGLSVDPAAVPRHSYTFEHGLTAGRALLESGHPPTAVFAGADPIALGVLEAARQLNIQVPEDLSVVGFDDTALARTSSPPLTTVHQPIAEIGGTAVANLLRLASGEVFTAKRVELSTHLVLRGTTAPPSGARPGASRGARLRTAGVG